MQGIDVRFFGRLADLFGKARTIECGPDGLTVAAIRERLGGEIADCERVKAAIDDELAGNDARVEPGGSVEFLPPVSGG